MSERRAALQGRIAALSALILDTEAKLERLRKQLEAAEDALAEMGAEIQGDFLTDE